MKTVSSHLKQTPQSLLDVQLQGYLCKVKKKDPGRGETSSVLCLFKLQLEYFRPEKWFNRVTLPGISDSYDTSLAFQWSRIQSGIQS